MMRHRKWKTWDCVNIVDKADIRIIPVAAVSEHNALYEAWMAAEHRVMEPLDENNRLDRDLDEARKRIAELEQPLRVPFSDEMIERMARAAQETMWRCGATWRSAISAALAAGGLEPCAPPEYDPADVALQPADDAWKTPLEMKDGDGDEFTTHCPDKHSVLLSMSAKDFNATPADAARMAAWLWSYAAAHGVVTYKRNPANSYFEGDPKPADVALQPTGHVLRDRLVDAERKVQNQRAELNRLNALAADLRTQLARESEWVRQYKQDRDDALAELADLRDEVDDDNTNAAAVNDLLIRVQNLTAERDALRERAAVPVKVRWDVSDDHIKMAVELGTFIRLDLDKVAHLREVFAAHAVIDVPAGVPSVEELHDIGEKAYYRAEFGDTSRSRVVAIRDRILAGLAQPSSNAGQFDDDEVEALARVLRDAHAKTCGKVPDAYELDGFRNDARAAIAHIRKRPEGLPTAEELADIGEEAYDAAKENKILARTAERRARFERAYMAVLPITTQFYLREQRFQAARMDAHRIALETVRQWDAMMAELDGEEG